MDWNNSGYSPYLVHGNVIASGVDRRSESGVDDRQTENDGDDHASVNDHVDVTETASECVIGDYACAHATYCDGHYEWHSWNGDYEWRSWICGVNDSAKVSHDDYHAYCHCVGRVDGTSPSTTSVGSRGRPESLLVVQLPQPSLNLELSSPECAAHLLSSHLPSALVMKEAAD